MNELEILTQLQPYLSSAGGPLVIGAGEDDTAAWENGDGSYTVATCDTSVEHVHFDLGRQAPQDVGWRALAFALGDLAAKGATPTYGFVAISIPRSWEASVVTGIYEGLAGLAAASGLLLVGGDTTSAPATGSLTLTVLGRTAVRPRPRSSAQAGWRVAVTGPLGSASLDCTRPLPLLGRGAELAARGLVCGDISDGLVREMDKVLAVSGTGCKIWLETVPRSPEVSAERALASGEEVQLFCLGPHSLLTGLAVVGELVPEQRVSVLDSNGDEVELSYRGYDHFA